MKELSIHQVATVGRSLSTRHRKKHLNSDYETMLFLVFCLCFFTLSEEHDVVSDGGGVAV